MSTPAEVNFTFQKGENCVIDWTIRVSDGGAVEDITGYTWSLKIKRLASDDDPSVADVTNAATDAANGVLQSTFSAAGLQGAYAYSLWRTNSGAKACKAKGTMTFEDTTES